MNDIEKLARRVCWLEFARRPTDTTEAKYWVAIRSEKREEYIQDAKWLVWMHRRLMGTFSGSMLLNAANEERSPAGKIVRGLRQAIAHAAQHGAR